MRKSRSRLLLEAMFAALVVGGIVLYAIQCRSENRAARRDIERLAALVNLGDSRDDVAAAIENLKSAYLSIDGRDETEWRIKTPGEFGATDWYLLIQFDSQETVAGIGPRTSDSAQRRPEGAGADRVAPDYRDSWHEKFKTQ